jgi:hypothetical protein
VAGPLLEQGAGARQRRRRGVVDLELRRPPTSDQDLPVGEERGGVPNPWGPELTGLDELPLRARIALDEALLAAAHDEHVATRQGGGRVADSIELDRRAPREGLGDRVVELGNPVVRAGRALPADDEHLAIGEQGGSVKEARASQGRGDLDVSAHRVDLGAVQLLVDREDALVGGDRVVASGQQDSPGGQERRGVIPAPRHGGPAAVVAHDGGRGQPEIGRSPDDVERPPVVEQRGRSLVVSPELGRRVHAGLRAHGRARGEQITVDHELRGRLIRGVVQGPVLLGERAQRWVEHLGWHPAQVEGLAPP